MFKAGYLCLFIMAPISAKYVNWGEQSCTIQEKQTFSSGIIAKKLLPRGKAVARILKLLIIFERVPVYSGLQWFKLD